MIGVMLDLETAILTLLSSEFQEIKRLEITEISIFDASETTQNIIN